MRKKFLSLVLAMCMVMSLFPMTALAAPGDTFNDVDGHWGQSAIERWSEYGVVNGDGTGSFAPDKQMTRAEFATMLANMLGYKDKAANTFADVNDSDWFADAILKLAAAGVIQGSNGMANPNAPISRQEAAVMMCRAFNIPTTGGNLDFADSADVADWAKGAVAALADRGMMNGVGNNNVAPLADINRASVATLLDNMITEYVTEDKTITGEVSGIVLVAADATVTVEDATLNENLIVAPKADGAEVTLTGNTTASDVVVDAAATVKVDSNATAGEVQATTSAAVTVAGKVDAVGGDASVSVTETGKVDNVAGSDVTVEKGAAVKDVAADKVTVAQGASVESVVCNNVTVEKDASVGSLTLTDASAKAEVSGTVKNVTVQENATGATVNTNSGATVGKVETAAKDVTVSGNGKVENVTATGGTANVTTPGTSVENKTDNKDNVTNNGKPVEPSTGGDTPTPTPPSGGGSSGGGSNPTTYAVTISGSVDHATVTASPTSAAAGATVTITITPDSGYSIKASSVSVKDANNEAIEGVTVTKVTDASYTFVMPAQAVTVAVTGTLEQDPVTNVKLQFVENRGDVSKLPTAVQSVLCLQDFLDKTNTEEKTNDMPWLVLTYNRVTTSAVTYEVYKDGFKLTDGFTQGTSPEKENANACQSWSMKPVDGSSGMLWAVGTSKALNGNYKVVLKVSSEEVASVEYEYKDTTEESFTVTFDSQGGSAVSSQTVLENGTLTEPTKPIRTGYDFGDWYTEVNGGGTAWDFSNTVTAATTLYAKWTATTYNITYELNSGTQGGTPATTYTIESDTITLPTPTKAGYKFDGWYTSEDLTGTAVTQITKGSTGNKTFYAKWTALYTVTLKEDGKDDVTISNVEAGSTLGDKLTTPTATGSTFLGWYAESDTAYATEYTKNTTINANVTLVPRFATTLTATPYDYSNYVVKDGALQQWMTWTLKAGKTDIKLGSPSTSKVEYKDGTGKWIDMTNKITFAADNADMTGLDANHQYGWSEPRAAEAKEYEYIFTVSDTEYYLKLTVPAAISGAENKSWPDTKIDGTNTGNNIPDGATNWTAPSSSN